MEQETPTLPGGENLIDLIGQLVEPTAPVPISMVPQTWGWLVLGMILLATLTYGVWRWVLARRASAYRRAALDLLNGAKDDPARIAEILRRVALAAYPREDVAALYGADWLHFLDRQIGGDAFSSGAGRILASAPYRPASPDPQLTRLAASWIRRHRAVAT